MLSVEMNEIEKIKKVAFKQVCLYGETAIYEGCFIDDEEQDIEEVINTLLAHISKLEQELCEKDKQVEEYASTNFKQSAKINEITGSRNAFHNELSDVLGLDKYDDNAPSVIDTIKELKKQVAELEKEIRLFKADRKRVSNKRSIIRNEAIEECAYEALEAAVRAAPAEDDFENGYELGCLVCEKRILALKEKP